ncbi:hypothetical protein KAI32_00870 [Candidatus Pacearchaeota archaeon]|nr:hypothetical protein [Candidatus Pacearchaeota archaeon]
MVNSHQTNQYCKIAGALKPMIESVGSREKRIVEILPKYQDFLNKLFDEGQFAALDELRLAHEKVKPSNLQLDYSKTDVPKFEDITFPYTPYLITEIKDIANEKSPLEKFALISKVLRKNPRDDIQTYIKKVNSILPEYQKLTNRLKENKSKLFNEFVWSQVSGLKTTYSVAWPEFMSLMIVGPHSTYVSFGRQTLKDSVNWVLSGGSKDGGMVEFLEPAKFYKHWDHINFPTHTFFEEGKEDKPKTTYSSIENVLADSNEYRDCTYFVAPKTRLSGLPINEGKPFETPLALNNWPGDISQVHVTKKPYDPIWDT